MLGKQRQAQSEEQGSGDALPPVLGGAPSPPALGLGLEETRAAWGESSGWESGGQASGSSRGCQAPEPGGGAPRGVRAHVHLPSAQEPAPRGQERRPGN